MSNYTDAFNRADGTVSSATWYSTNTSFPTILSNAVNNDQVGNSYVCTYRSALASGRSTSQITLTTKGTSSPIGGPCIAMNIATPAPVGASNRWNAYAATPFYRFVAKTAGYQLQKKQDGVSTFTDVGSQYTTTPTNGQVLKIEYDENTGILNGYINGVLRCTYTDPAPVTGGRYSGFSINNGTILDTWAADDLIAAPVANFTKNVASGVSPLTVNFTDTSTGTPTSWSWAFGDGTTSTSQNPSHVFANAGSYSVVLTATNAGGSNASTAQTVTVSNPVATGRVKRWSGTAWVSKPLKARLAGAWVDKTANLKVWNGTAWVAPAGAGDPPPVTQGSILHSIAGFSGFQNGMDLAPAAIHGSPILLTAGDVAGIARSDDGGAYWWACNSYIQTVSPRKALSGVHWSRYRPGVAWGFSHGGIVKSTNYGVTFNVTATTTSSTNPETGGSEQPRQTGRMIHEGANGRVYLGTKDGIYRSADNNGTSFTSWALAGEKVKSITEDPIDNSMLYVATIGGTATGNPGVYAINVSTGAATRFALGDVQDLVAIDVAGVTHLYVAAGFQGVRRWIRSGASGATSAILSGWTNITGVIPTGDVSTLTGTEQASSTNTSITLASIAGFANSGNGSVGKDQFSWTSITGTTLNGVTWNGLTGLTYPPGTAVCEKVNGGSAGRWGAIDAVYSGGNVVIMVGFWDSAALVTDGNLGTGVTNKFKTVWRTVNGLSNPPTWADDSSDYVQLGMVGETSRSFFAWVDNPYLKLNGSTGDVSQIRIDPNNTEIVYASGRNVNSKRVSGNPPVWRPAGRGHNAWIGHEVSSHPSDPTKIISSAVDWVVISSDTRFETGSPYSNNNVSTNASYGIKIGSDGKGYVASANRDNASNGEAGGVFECANPWFNPASWTSTGMPSGLGRGVGVEVTFNGATRRLVAFIHCDSGATDPQAGFWYKNGTAAWVRCATGQGAFVKNTLPAGGVSVPIMVSPSSPGTLYGMVSWDGLWRSTDYGVTWTRIWAKTAGDKTQRSLTMDPITSNRIAITVGLEMWIITNAHNGTLNANGTTASGTIAATKNALGGVQQVSARPNGRLFALTTGPNNNRMHTSTDWSTFSSINVGKLGEVVRGVFDMHATSDRVYLVGDGEGVVVVNPGVT